MAESHPPDRLYRDAGGAALERAARLEDENRRLRAEVERLRVGAGGGDGNGDPRTVDAEGADHPGRPRVAATYLAVATATMAVLLASAMTVRTRHVHYVHVDRGGHTASSGIAIVRPPSPLPAPVVIGASPSQSDESCTPAYVVDERGVRHYKAHCMGGAAATFDRHIERSDPWACSAPYSIDADGVRHYRPECLTEDK
jgi:hypothetical protein